MKFSARLRKAGGTVIEQGETSCCYAKSEKSWIDDPAGISWETFLTTGESTDYGDGTGEREARIAQDQGVLRAGSYRAAPSRVRRAMADHPFNVLVPLHRKFGPLDHGRGNLEQARRREISRVQRGQPAERTVHPETLRLLQGAGLRHVALSLEVLERIRQARRATARFRIHGLRQRRWRNLPGMAGPADDRALGDSRSGRGQG